MGDPVAIIVKPLVDKIIKDSISSIKEMYSSVKGIKKAIEKLESNLTAIQAVLIDAEQKQVKDPPIRDWLLKLQNAAMDAEDILDIYATEASLSKQKQLHLPVSTSQVHYKSNAAKKITAISTRFDQIAREKQDFHLDIKVDGVIPDVRPPTGWFLDKSDVVGRETDKENIIKMVLSDEYEREDEVFVLPIVGMGGLGKTTLAQFVFNDDRIKSRFGSRMWVCVTANFNLTRILKEMIEYLSEMQVNINLSRSQLEARFLDILDGKRFFLVLDDVWTKDQDDWELLLRLLKQGLKGSRVLLTSRMTNVSDTDGTLPPYPLEYLPEEQCRLLFSRFAFARGTSSRVANDLEAVGREIVAKCKGLPLAVKAMAGLLRGKDDASEWRAILKSEIWEVEEQEIRTGRTKTLPALKLSYEHLPSHLKRCFTYCSIFPKAYIFDKNELVKLWAAENFIHFIGGQERMEKTGILYFDELLMRSFFQPSIIDNKERFVMHDLIHDLSQSVSIPHSCQVKDNEHHTCCEQSRYISILCEDVEQPALKIIEISNKLRTLLLPGDRLKNFGVALDHVFRKLKYLRVLDLSSSTISKLSSSIEELKLLRYLDLSKTQIKKLPEAVCNLYNLQTLKLLECPWLLELPKDMGKLVNLRHLELDDMFWFKCPKLPPKMGNLTSLRNLHSFQVDNDKGYGMAQLKNMLHLTGSLHISKLENAVNAAEANLNEKESLQKLILEWSDPVIVNQQDEATEEKTLQDLVPNSNLIELQIYNFQGSSFPPWVGNGELQNLGIISLKGCRRCKSLSLDLPHLSQLYISGMPELENCSGLKCPSLIRFKLSNCPKLKQLPPFFPNLRVLKIKGCNSLRALPVAPSMMFMILIDNLILEDWREAIVPLTSRNGQGEQETSIQYSFIKLLELKVMNCPKIQSLPIVFAPQKLEISGCGLLSTLPSPQYAKRLQHLALDGCHDTLVSEIPNSNSIYSLVISRISNLSSLPQWPSLPELKSLHIHGCHDLLSLSEQEEEEEEEEEEEGSFRSLRSLKLLSIRNCEKLETLPKKGLSTSLECLIIGLCPKLQSLGPKEMLKNLVSLKDLYIEDCPLLGSLPEDGLPSALQHLRIQKCPILIDKCGKDGAPDWPMIKHIPDLEIEPA